MQENIQNYSQSDLKFSSSKLYFQHQNQILQKIWFISPMSIDIHFKYTFQEIQPNYFIEWWEFEWLTIDHDIHEQWIIYKIWFINPKFQNIENCSLDMKKNYLDNPSIWPLIRGLLWWLIVFSVLAWLWSKSQFGKILLWINLIWALILLTFYGIKIGKRLFKKINTKSMEYWWFTANYSKESDSCVLSNDIIKILKDLSNNYRISKFCYTGNCIYLLQDFHDHNWDRLKSSSKLYTEQEKANLQQKTMEFLNNKDFLSYFS
jgi:hypothetical protein